MATSHRRTRYGFRRERQSRLCSRHNGRYQLPQLSRRRYVLGADQVVHGPPLINLHTHTNHSDGSTDPGELDPPAVRGGIEAPGFSARRLLRVTTLGDMTLEYYLGATALLEGHPPT